MADLDAVVAAVASSSKYRAVCEDTIRRAAERELAAVPGGGLKAVVKATKRRLHQVYGAFEQDPDYGAAYRRLEPAYRGRVPAEIEAACRHVLGLHASTRERLPIIGRLYESVWALTGRPGSVLDLGCGLNPLALPWMGLDPGCRYVALDIDRDRAAFLSRFLSLAGVDGVARCQDILAHPPDDTADVALLLKMSPTLERQEPGATGRLIEALRTRFVVVSFAVRSLGGREKGMVEQYQRQLLGLAGSRAWTVERLAFETELVFVVQCPGGATSATRQRAEAVYD